MEEREKQKLKANVYFPLRVLSCVIIILRLVLCVMGLPDTRHRITVVAEGGGRHFPKLILSVLGCQHHQLDWSNAAAVELLIDAAPLC